MIDIQICTGMQDIFAQMCTHMFARRWGRVTHEVTGVRSRVLLLRSRPASDPSRRMRASMTRKAAATCVAVPQHVGRGERPSPHDTWCKPRQDSRAEACMGAPTPHAPWEWSPGRASPRPRLSVKGWDIQKRHSAMSPLALHALIHTHTCTRKCCCTHRTYCVQMRTTMSASSTLSDGRRKRPRTCSMSMHRSALSSRWAMLSATSSKGTTRGRSIDVECAHRARSAQRNSAVATAPQRAKLQNARGTSMRPSSATPTFRMRVPEPKRR